MSVTTAIGYPEVKQWLTQHYPAPRIQLSKVLAPSINVSNNAMIGTAFDYLVRFTIERMNNEILSSRWIADIAIGYLAGEYGPTRRLPNGHLGVRVGPKVDMGIPVIILDITDDAVTRLSYMVDQAHHLKDEFCSGANLTDELLYSCIDLAHIDRIVRIGSRFDSTEWQYTTEQLQDLWNLHDVLYQSAFLSAMRETTALLNPAIVWEDANLEGDCDLITYGTLIDIKTVQSTRTSDWHQVVLYAIAANHGLTEPAILSPITNIGFYYSRHGMFTQFPIDMDLVGELSEIICGLR